MTSACDVETTMRSIQDMKGPRLNDTARRGGAPKGRGGRPGAVLRSSVPVVLAVVLAGVVAAAVAPSASASSISSWPSYVLAPHSRQVAPAAVIGTSASGVTDANALLATGGGAAQLHLSAGNTPYIDIDFGREVAGNLELSFAGASNPAPEVRVAFSETRQYLGDRSDFSRSDFSGGNGTDNHVPSNSGGETWVDRAGCQFDGHVCADGLRGFRYVRIYLGSPQGDAPYAADTGDVSIDAVRLHFTPYLGTPDTYKGHFLSSDDELNRIWYSSAYTVELNMDKFAQNSVDPRGSWDAAPDLHNKPALLDGPKRDRSPGNADLAVSGLTDLVSHAYTDPLRNVLADLAIHQRADGYVPYGPVLNFSVDLFDYSAWWVVASQIYTLYSGDLAYASTYWPTLQRLMDDWFPAVTDANGLLSKGLDGTSGYGDYQFSSRQGESSYYNAMYVLALQDGASLASKLGHATEAAAWRARAQQVTQAMNARLWDPVAGAYTEQGTEHWEDGNSMAIAAGVPDAARTQLAIDFMTSALTRPWGNATNDTGSNRVYPLFNYYDALARFQAGDDNSALELIRRTWGWMLGHGGPGTTWEAIGPGGGIDTYEGAYTSMAHGWSAGAAAALSTQVLGIQPTGYGFDQYAFIPHPGSLAWTRGAMPTPHGSITASWHHDASKGQFAEHLDSPAGTTATAGVPTFGQPISVSVDGSVVWNGTTAVSPDAHSDGRYVYVDGLGPGSHDIVSHVASSTAAIGPPVATSVTPASATVGQHVTLNGSGFGATQGSSYVELSDNGSSWGGPGQPMLQVDSWSDSAVTFTVPSGVFPGSSASTGIFTGSGATSGPAFEIAPSANPADYYNNTGTSPDSNPSCANFDGGGFSYSANALASAGLTPGETITADGLSFTWTSAQPCSPDNILAAGQTMLVSGPAGSNTLGLLESSSDGGTQGTITINYTDGTSSTATITSSDWAAGPSSTETVAATMPYRNNVSGSSQQPTVYVYATRVPVDPSKTVESITLPNVSDAVAGPTTAMHIWAVSLGTT